MSNIVLRLVLALSIFASIWGCQSDIAMSRAVRVGDTIAVSLGNADPTDTSASSLTPSNVIHPLLKSGPNGDVSAEIWSDLYPSVKYPVHIRYLFRAYSDPTGSAPEFRGMAMWIAVVDLADENGNAVSLSPGDATLEFSSSKFDSNHAVYLEILPGQGDSHDFFGKQTPSVPTDIADQFSWIEPAPQAAVEISGTLPSGKELGAAKFVFDIPDVDDTSGNKDKVAVAPARFPSQEQVTFHVEKRASVVHSPGTRVSIFMTAPEGLDNSRIDRFNFVMTSELTSVNTGPNDYWNTYWVTAETALYDTNGDTVTLTTLVGDIE